MNAIGTPKEKERESGSSVTLVVSCVSSCFTFLFPSTARAASAGEQETNGPLVILARASEVSEEVNEATTVNNSANKVTHIRK